MMTPPGTRESPTPALYIGAAALAIWEAAARSGVISPLFFPPPSLIAATTWRLLLSGELIENGAATLLRVLAGMLLGGIPGLILGLFMGWSRSLRVALDPFIAAAHPLPKIALLPLIMIIFGIGEPSKVFVAALGAFFPLLINAMAGVRAIHAIHFEVARNYGARPLHVMRRVVLPGSLPHTLSGWRLAFNMSLLLTIAAEIVSARVGLGAVIWLAWETMRPPDLYASLVVIVLFGLAANAVLDLLGRRLTPWLEEPGQAPSIRSSEA